MHGSVHDFIVSQTVADWQNLPTGFSGGALIPTVLPIVQEPFEQRTFPKALEIGSLDINGSMVAYDFIGARTKWVNMIGCEEYIGIDIVPGPKVDIVMDAHNLEFEDNSFDLVLCMNMLEHDSDIHKTFSEAYRVLKPGGLFLATTVDEGHPEHMEVHPIELPYNHITEQEFENYITSIKPKAYKKWHFGCDLMARIEK